MEEDILRERTGFLENKPQIEVSHMFSQNYFK
jgi:hypothetical protein